MCRVGPSCSSADASHDARAASTPRAARRPLAMAPPRERMTHAITLSFRTNPPTGATDRIAGARRSSLHLPGRSRSEYRPPTRPEVAVSDARAAHLPAAKLRIGERFATHVRVDHPPHVVRASATDRPIPDAHSGTCLYPRDCERCFDGTIQVAFGPSLAESFP